MLKLGKESKVNKRKIKELELSNKLLKKDIESIKREVLKLERVKADSDYETQTIATLGETNESLLKEVTSLSGYCSKLVSELL